MAAIGGLTVTGFLAPTVDELVTDINTKVLAAVNAGLDLSPDQPIGQIIGIVAEKLAEQWELLATVYNSMNPDAAEGNLLDNICAITGTRRRSATYSRVVANVNLNGSTTLTAGAVASVNGQPANRWVLTANAVNGALTPAAVPSTWRSEQPGPFVANSGTLGTIATPTIGWNSITNPTDATQGIVEDSDTTLRQERAAEITASGSSTVNAIRADVLLVAGVLQAFVFENTTRWVDSQGIPPHSILVIIWDGTIPAADNVKVAQAIWNSKPAGIGTFGANSADATDSQGNIRTMYFTRATPVQIYLDYSISFPNDGTVTVDTLNAVKANIAAYALVHQNLGNDVIELAYRAIPIATPPIYDTPVLYMDIGSYGFDELNIPIANTQIAIITTDHIRINGF